jgi:RHH-type proline utilization regulon transcriptional repressor/proline dehydrogenase/delta 1-pyrroline-5-carboxylate dehydrogenase
VYGVAPSNRGTARAVPDERDVRALALRIAELGAGERAQFYQMTWWTERMLTWAMANPGFRTQLFRLVDVFPATTGADDALRHLHEYFSGADAPRLVDLGVGLAERLPGGDRLSASVARRNIERMARQFIAGSTPADAAGALGRLWRSGSAGIVDLLGEKSVSADEADRYAAGVSALVAALGEAAAAWPPDDHLERDDLGPLPRASVSVKPTALAPRLAPLTAEEGRAELEGRLRAILELAAEAGVGVWLDMERYETKDLVAEVWLELLEDPRLAKLHAGTVLQAYLRDAASDLEDLLAWARRRQALGPCEPLAVRLVKGAYWDTETIEAAAEGWPSPVFEHKAQTDANYERLVRRLHEHHGLVRAAFATHNLRSLAFAVCQARVQGIPDTGYEVQMLYGMAEPVHAAIRRLGFRLRVYTPVGELVPGMAYLIRRLLENTANESFVRQRFAEGRRLEELLEPPGEVSLPGPAPPTEPAETDASDPGPYRHQPVLEWRRRTVRRSFAEAVAATGRSLRAAPLQVTARIGGDRVTTGRTLASVDPGDPERLVAEATSCGTAEAAAAVAQAAVAFERWRRVPARERAAVLFRAARWMRDHRLELAALEVYEAGKPWADADADVCEAIDYCEYYGREALRLAAGGAVCSPPGEHNALVYQPKGVGVVISPWNFPLAIPTGMVVAALVVGNAVVLKPAEQAPACASMLVEALEAAGLPEGVLGFCPGPGEVVGDALVRHPGVAFVAFTGSRDVGLSIVEAAATHQAGQRQVKRVVAEMGGKNPIVVDSDADLDQAVPAIVRSAFGYAGQKCSACSRLVVVDPVHDRLLERLVGAAALVRVGHPSHPSTLVGPLIEAGARTRVLEAVEEAAASGAGRLVLARDDVPERGYFVGPRILDDVDPESHVATEELFGPVLAVLRAGSFAEALELANATDYALTAGVFSRSPGHIAEAAAELRAGNVYVNRAITGAIPGRQPFGGYGLSGVGSKAGGPDYLLQFVDPRVVTENTVRQGFAPLGDQARAR